MLSNTSISLALQILQSLKAKGIKGVKPVENTPLSIISRPAGITIDGTSTMDSLAIQISIMVNGNIGDVNEPMSQHTVDIDAFIRDFRAATVRHVDYARNVVKPFVVEICERCVDYLKTFVPESIAAYEITVLPVPALFQNALLRTWANAKGELDDKFNPNLYMPDVSVAQIREQYLVTKLASAKKDLDVWAASLTDERVAELWSRYFGHRYGAGDDASLGGILGVIPTVSPRANMDALLFGLIVTSALEDNPPAGVGMTLGGFNSEVTLLNSKLRAWYCHEFDTYLSDINAHAMAYSRTGTRITVYPETYAEFVERGGKADAILGRLVSGKDVFTVEQYLEAQPELISSWEQFTSIKFMASNNERFARARETMVSFFAKAIEEDTDPVIVDKAKLIAAFTARADKLTLEQFSQLGSFQDFVLAAVCDTRFAHTNAYEILSGINRVCENNPRIQPREAAALATIEYLPRWLGSTIKAF